MEQAQRGSNGSTLKGEGLDVPLSVLPQQRLHVLKYFLKVPVQVLKVAMAMVTAMVMVMKMVPWS